MSRGVTVLDPQNEAAPGCVRALRSLSFDSVRVYRRADALIVFPPTLERTVPIVVGARVAHRDRSFSIGNTGVLLRARRHRALRVRVGSILIDAALLILIGGALLLRNGEALRLRTRCVGRHGGG
jgi:hypothetical protein